MNERVEAAVASLKALGYTNVTDQFNESRRIRYMARHNGQEPPEEPHTQVWHWRAEGRFVQVIVNAKTGVCITQLDTAGDCLGDVLRAAKAGDNV